MNFILVDHATWTAMQDAISRIDSNVIKIAAQQTKEIKIMSDISDAVAALTARVTTVQGTEASALTLIQGIVAQLNAALANAKDDAAAVTAVKALAVQLQASDDPLAAAVVAANPPPTP